MASNQLTLATRDVHAPLTVAVLHVNEIAVDDDVNPRHEREEMAGLTGSLGRYGQLQNVNVIEREAPDENGRRYDLIAGRSRYASVREHYDNGSGTGQILVIIHPLGSDARGIALTENLQRVQMKPGEIARAVRAYADEHEISEKEIADQLDRTVETVRGYLRLARTLPPIALFKLDTGALTKTAAERLLPLADRAPELVHAVIAQAGEGIASSEIAANPDLVLYEAVRDRRVDGVYAEPFTGGVDVLDVRDVITRALKALEGADRDIRDAAPIADGTTLAGELAQRDPSDRVAHVEPSDVHRVAQTAPDGAIVDLDTKTDTDGEVLSRAVVCTNPTLMLEWGITAAKRLLSVGGPAPSQEDDETNLMELTAEAMATVKADAHAWNRTLADFCHAISDGCDGCDLQSSVTQLLLGSCLSPGRLLVGQGLGHVRGDWRAESVAVEGGRIEARERGPLGADEAQRRFEEEVLGLEVDAAVRLTTAAIVAGALCDTREIGARERNRQLRLQAADDSPAGQMPMAIVALADAWEHAPEDFAQQVRTRLDIDETQELTSVDPSALKRRSRA